MSRVVLVCARALGGLSCFAFFLYWLAPMSAEAQVASSNNSQRAAPRVFLECQGNVPCNQNFFRTEIRFVNWARDPDGSDVHVLITSEPTGGGGRRYILDFMGHGSMTRLSDNLTYTADGRDVSQETLEGLTQTLRLGLLRFAVESGFGSDFVLDFTGRIADAANGDAQDDPSLVTDIDPWNYWTFQVGMSGDMNLQSSRSRKRLNTDFRADRITEDWKLEVRSSARLWRDEIELPNGRIVHDNRDRWQASTLLVRSLTDHVSAGFDVGGSSAVQSNRWARVTFTPAAEWNYYPYDQAHRRQFIAHYGAGVQYNRYMEETIFGVTTETLPLHKLGIQYRAIESWGNASVGISASQYLHRSSLYNVGIQGNLSLRITRGLEFSLSASAELVEDEIHYPLASVSAEDILLGRQSLPSSYEYEASMGLRYRFGSDLVNIVNTRFPGSVR